VLVNAMRLIADQLAMALGSDSVPITLWAVGRWKESRKPTKEAQEVDVESAFATATRGPLAMEE